MGSEPPGLDLEETVRSACLNYLLLAVTIAGAGSGCARPRPELNTRPLSLAAPIRGTAFVADGAGGWSACSKSLRRVVAQTKTPLEVETVQWTHGFGRVLADQCDYANSRLAGQQLAEKILAYRQSCPGQEVYLIGHSAGNQVVLAAAEALPPDSVDRIILLAPAVSFDYDLRPALRASRQGIDVFCSKCDWWFLGVAVHVIGTSDRRWTDAAGKDGFQPVVETPADAALYAKLRQYQWGPELIGTGNCGGHFGPYQPGHLREFVLPLLECNP